MHYRFGSLIQVLKQSASDYIKGFDSSSIVSWSNTRSSTCEIVEMQCQSAAAVCCFSNSSFFMLMGIVMFAFRLFQLVNTCKSNFAVKFVQSLITVYLRIPLSRK